MEHCVNGAPLARANLKSYGHGNWPGETFGRLRPNGAKVRVSRPKHSGYLGANALNLRRSCQTVSERRKPAGRGGGAEYTQTSNHRLNLSLGNHLGIWPRILAETGHAHQWCSSPIL